MHIVLFLRNKNFSIYTKLLSSFLIVLIPVFTVALIANYDGAQKVKTEIEKTIKSKVNSYQSTFDSEMLRVINMRNEYILDKDLQDISVLSSIMSPYQFAQSVSRIVGRLNVLRSSSLYVSDVEVGIPSLNRTISVTSYENSVNEIELLQLNTVLDDSIIEDSNEYYIYGAYPLSLPEGVAPLYSVKILLSQEKIVQSLSEMVFILRGGGMLFGSEMDWTLQSGENEDMRAHFQPYVQAFIAEKKMEQNEWIKIDDVRYFVSMERSERTGTTLLFYVQEDKILGPLKENQTWLVALSIVSLFVVALFAYWIHRLIRKPIQVMVQALRNVEHGRTGVTIKYRFRDEFNYMYNQFNAMTRRLDVLIYEVYEQQIRTQRAELKQLQSQINPHFLYNSYFVLYRIAHMKDLDNVQRLAKHLGEYFRFITRNESEDVSLLEEWNHTQAYIEIQMFRYKRRMKTVYDPLLPEHHRLMLPRLLLQPIIENAYEHGLLNKRSDGLVTIRFVTGADGIVISIEDNGEEIADEQIVQLQRKLTGYNDIAETTGMINVHRRIQLKFGKPFGLWVLRASIGGLCVQIYIPGQEN
ncbi:sensor histidine kinase [Paenibacillus eucommiae]|uniref:Two-component system sensor histidine kinase YesM n=1 Tax=Paenibacillus eucommiae TaxID=1355755 RepID=A0ABS4IXY3_9BACL|nr:histidine kinase [Paenibacillus eucommiae]MBP1992432.1 two-component system sensor histidine kinase YesM [Paenibacillus eucommiae]